MKEEKMKERLKKQIEVCEKEKNEYLDGWKRARADFINYKKEEFQRIERGVQENQESMLKKILLIFDNFERAKKEVEKQEKSDDLIEGFLKIKEQVECFLKEEGIEEIKAAGEEFDPFYHEAIEVVESDSLASGVVFEETQKGYLCRGKVLRPAKVKVVK